MGKFKVRRLKVPEGCPEVTVRDSPDELTLSSRRSGYVEDIHQCQPHRKRKMGSSPVVDYDWCAFCQALYKGIEGEDWGETKK